MKIRKILVANRGEIASRIIRTAREMNILTVAVFSDADRLMPYTRLADESYPLGDADPFSSYLNREKLLAITKKCGADAIHPGYGFLSENAEFAEETGKTGCTFIGPRPESIRMMGDKLVSKKMALMEGVPVVPGHEDPVTTIEVAIPVAKEIGYPVLIKAAAGGGGKGMRVVRNERELAENVERARSESKHAFDSEVVFIEKYIENPRHIEIQVFGDSEGNYIHLYERDCSIQRRHQKLVEESPSPAVNDDLRNKLAASAIKIARACRYLGAGTVEFMVDRTGNFYFLEMNTRLQVEHPVTELITGTDLVREQILVASGKKLSYNQDEIRKQGHAVEFRVYAEDPSNDFLPSSGRLDVYKIPKGPGVRVDDGYEEHLTIPIHYDPLIGKLLVHGRTRENSIAILKRAIEEYQISPIPTTLDFGKFLCANKSFRNGTYDTSFIAAEFKRGTGNQRPPEESVIAAALAGYVHTREKSDHLSHEINNNKNSRWKWRRR